MATRRAPPSLAEGRIPSAIQRRAVRTENSGDSSDFRSVEVFFASAHELGSAGEIVVCERSVHPSSSAHSRAACRASRRASAISAAKAVGLSNSRSFAPTTFIAPADRSPGGGRRNGEMNLFSTGRTLQNGPDALPRCFEAERGAIALDGPARCLQEPEEGATGFALVRTARDH